MTIVVTNMSEHQLRFFKDRHAAFSGILASSASDKSLPEVLLDDAFAQFDAELETQCQGAAAIDCKKGCATCCTVRVTATAPEVLRVAQHLRESVSPEACVRLVRRLLEADGLTRDLDESERVQLRHRCPFIEKGACVIYPVRPLACRGHASHSRRDCVQAAAGRVAEVPYSVPHQTVRALVQNAMQSAMRDAGLAWISYELNHALRIALSESKAAERWALGEDVFADAVISDISAEEMASGFDQIKKLM